MKTIFITGAYGFIGRAVCKRLCLKYKIIALNKIILNEKKDDRVVCIKGNITDELLIKKICDAYAPDVVIHCAGIAHQKINGFMDERLYDEVNHLATRNLAKAAVKANPNVHFIFLSSISVYGEKHNCREVKEEDLCSPTTEYARSKLNAENGLKTYFHKNFIKKLDLFRLSPVYDSTCSQNLEKRVFMFQKLFYLRVGTGNQKMSVLARENLVDFILYRIENNSMQKFCNVFNVSDKSYCSFNTIIKIFKKSAYQPDRRVVEIPLWLVWVTTRIAGFLIKSRAGLIYSFYDKLSNDLIFDNSRMLNTGFKPKHTLKSVFIK